MKTSVSVISLLLLVTPVMATDVTITAVAGPGPNNVTVGFTTSNLTEPVRMICLDVIVDDPNVVIGDIHCINTEYGIYPGSISIDAVGNVTDWGTCAGSGMGSNTVATEQGSLYIGAANAPAQSGDLFIIILEGCECEDGNVEVSITENALRAGIVLEDPDVAANVTLPGDVTVSMPQCDCTQVCPSCLGDITDTTSIASPDGRVDTGDLAALLTALILYGDPNDNFNVTGAPNQSVLLYCMEFTDTTSIGPPDGRIDTGDMAFLLTYLILNGNPANNYAAPCM